MEVDVARHHGTYTKQVDDVVIRFVGPRVSYFDFFYSPYVSFVVRPRVHAYSNVPQ